MGAPEERGEDETDRIPVTIARTGRTAEVRASRRVRILGAAGFILVLNESLDSETLATIG
jgi:hypothetical protein